MRSSYFVILQIDTKKLIQFKQLIRNAGQLVDMGLTSTDIQRFTIVSLTYEHTFI